MGSALSCPNLNGKETMNKLIITLALITTNAHATWFAPDPEIVNLQNQLAQQHNATGFWLTVAGALAFCVIIAFITGTILGSRTRRNAQRPPFDEQ